MLSVLPKDERQAISWYRQAAEQGYAGAQLNLGLAYESGIAGSPDVSAALQWITKAANQGSAMAQDTVGYFYSHGIGVHRDDIEAATWFRKAAQQGMAGAQYNLGTMYEQGIGVDQNRDKAELWYQMAADQGHEAAKQKLASWATSKNDATAFGDDISHRLNPIQPAPLGLPDTDKPVFVKRGHAICKAPDPLIGFTDRLASLEGDASLRTKFIAVMGPIHSCTIAEMDTLVEVLRTSAVEESLRQRILKYVAIRWTNSDGTGGFGYVLVAALR